jgi:hypothetical protein
MLATTPTVLSPELLALCAQVAAGSKPAPLVRTAPADARPVDCFETVERQITERGGTACFGWLLWECQRLFLEAEFYAVWRDAQGALHDITPRVGPAHVLFLPDPVRVFEGRRVPSVRRPLTQDPAVTGFLRACEEEFELINRGARAFARNISLDGPELGELQLIWQRKIAYSQRLALLGTAEA